MACPFLLTLGKVANFSVLYHTNVIDSWKFNDKSASGAPQQLVNGLYRCVEFTYLIGNKSDSWGIWSSYFSSVYDSWVDINMSCQGAPRKLLMECIDLLKCLLDGHKHYSQKGENIGTEHRGRVSMLSLLTESKEQMRRISMFLYRSAFPSGRGELRSNSFLAFLLTGSKATE